MNQYGRSRRQSRRIAMCGLLAALSVVLLSLGGMIPFAGIACPMLAMLCMLPTVCEYGAGTSLVQYAASAALGALLCADQEASLLYVFLGWYPALRPKLEGLPKIPRILMKTAVFTAALAAMYGVILYLFRLEAVIAEFAEYSAAAIAGLLALGCLSFLLLDRTMGILSNIYQRRRK